MLLTVKKPKKKGITKLLCCLRRHPHPKKYMPNNHKSVLREGEQNVPAIIPEFTVKSTKENLRDAIAGETYEITTMYPEFIVNANKAGNQFSLNESKLCVQNRAKT